DGQWHTVSCVKTSTAIEVVVDGQVFSKAANIGSISNTTDVAIGARPGSDWYQGQLDEASISIG
ncbi:MAG TPA: LamG-like jellyroll fold domain-containing protein, partial [Gaiellaceae bacterium]|nr:LamG-like jellyroll fold domain-containing protein [Gaiellaceae bacterium]